MPRSVILVLDSLGIGAAADAADYGDAGADTLGHIADWFAARGPGLHLPNLMTLGLAKAAEAASGRMPPGLAATARIAGRYGYGVETSRGKDTPSGHWEIAGVPVTTDWGYFPDTRPCFPADLVATLVDRCGLPGILGDCHASGTAIIAELGEEHVRTGRPILYSSADSVLQIAAHEEAFGLDRLYQVCQVARELCDALRIGRVIARPFAGSSAADFQRTANRRDYAVPPPAPTLLELATRAGRDVVTVGKIGDIFAHVGTGTVMKAAGNMALFDRTLEGLDRLAEGGLLMANFIDFDSLYGHRRDPKGYGQALRQFDRRLPELDARLRPGDLVVITADHGCDPTFAGSDHTREYVPILAYGPGQPTGPIGRRETFADIAATLARHLALPAPGAGTPF
ncbi:phosphopentomutase [Phreatobacter sp. AB_2022a]|uniref:phosphopentomutase n=1 Tax=Phreatobacter sp. AB_2022a TaxID=3003134 RepID=UPI00228752D4|nr:phosphopentomutase [Phreatobacter sp. AB_2022a]MCZ0737166.1 phosphopentomutase [Phreatobacter sp. AB_2022a]